jgi:hypothetical protein
MNACRRWIDPMLEKKLAESRGKGDEMLGYAAALLPTHPEMYEILYGELFPIKTNPRRGYDDGLFYTGIFSLRVLRHYVPDFKDRMRRVAADRKQKIGHRYLASSVLLDAEPTDSGLQAIVSNIITDHDFEKEPSARFYQVGDGKSFVGLPTPQIRSAAKVCLLNRINTLHESACPYPLIRFVFGKPDCLTTTAEAYLNGHFSLKGLRDSQELINDLIQTRGASSALVQIFQKATPQSEKESRGKAALAWLKDQNAATPFR